MIDGGTAARYSATGHLIYYQAGTLMAAPFDPVRVETSGNRLPLQEAVKTTASGAANYALSRTGTLVMIPGSTRPERKLVWVDRKNNATPVLDAADDYWLPRLSPDGTRLAVGIGWDIWVLELARSTRTRLTYGTTSVLFPFAWTRRRPRVIFSKIENKIGLDLYTVAADGSGQPELLLRGDQRQWATSWSPTADVIATYEQHPTTLRDIWLVNADRTRSPFLVSPYQERAARFSPDGKWIAYVSNDSGRDEVYVRPASGGGGKTTVSTEGGIEPVWAASGRELFYRNGDDFMVAPVETVPALSIGRPQRLFTAAYERDRGAGFANPNYDVTRDGQRFVMVQAPSISSQHRRRVELVRGAEGAHGRSETMDTARSPSMADHHRFFHSGGGWRRGTDIYVNEHLAAIHLVRRADAVLPVASPGRIRQPGYLDDYSHQAHAVTPARRRFSGSAGGREHSAPFPSVRPGLSREQGNGACRTCSSRVAFSAGQARQVLTPAAVAADRCPGAVRREHR